MHIADNRKEYCFVEELKEVELRSLRGKFIYTRPYNPVGLNKVSHSSGRGRAPSRLPMNKLKSLFIACYTCNMHVDARIEGYHYCMPLETLLALNYTNNSHS